MPPKVISERLGHSTVAMTLDICSHAIPALQYDAAATIADLVSGAAVAAHLLPWSHGGELGSGHPAPAWRLALRWAGTPPASRTLGTVGGCSPHEACERLAGYKGFAQMRRRQVVPSRAASSDSRVTRDVHTTSDSASLTYASGGDTGRLRAAGDDRGVSVGRRVLGASYPSKTSWAGRRTCPGMNFSSSP